MEDLLHSGRTGQFWATHNIKFLPRKLKIYPNLVTRHQEKLGQETTAQIRWECQILFVKDFYISQPSTSNILFSETIISDWSSDTMMYNIHTFSRGESFRMIKRYSPKPFTGQKVSHQCCFVVNQLEKLVSAFAY